MKKRILTILACIVLVAITFCSTFLSGCIESADQYTVEEHIERVSALVEKRYMTNDSEYSNYTVYPLYNEQEKLGYMLIEFEPCGFLYVEINEEKLHFPGAVSMYIRDALEGEPWHRFIVEEDGVTEVWEVDENGDIIDYNNSHFKIANIQNEKRYLLKSINGYIPAVKRDEGYLNLITMQAMDYETLMNVGINSVARIQFIPKKSFDL